MRKFHLGPNSAVFLVFFGVAVLESFASRNLVWMILWIIIGTFFILSDNLGKRSEK